MDFRFKYIVVFLAFMLFSPILLATEGKLFLLPQSDEDPLQLKLFLHHHAPTLSPFYQEIQNAKADADTEKLFKLKEAYETINGLAEACDNLVQQLAKKVKSDLVMVWPEQSAKQFLGSILFYPQELLHNPEGDEKIYSYPGLAASLTISASFKNPIAIYELSKGYSNIAKQCRVNPPEDQKEEIEQIQISEDRERALQLYQEAIRLFKRTQNPNEITRFYLTKHSYGKENTISDKDFRRQLQNIDHPYAFHELGVYYEQKDNSVAYKPNRQPGATTYIKKSYEYYRKALENGYEKAIFGIYRLSHEIEENLRTEEDLYKKGKAQGLYLSAERSNKRKHTESGTKELYDQSAQAGRLYSYIELAEKILREELPSSDRIKEAIFYFQKADRPGFARGTRIIVGLPNLCSQPSVELDFTLHMIKLKDIQGFENLLMCWGIKRYHPSITAFFTSKEEVLKTYQSLLQERAKIIDVIKNI